MSSNIVECSGAPPDAISSIRWSRDGSVLAVAAWDSRVYLASFKDGTGPFTIHGACPHTAPVLDVCWGPEIAANDQAVELYFAALDQMVGVFRGPLPAIASDGTPAESTATATTLVGRHGKAANKIAFSPEHNLILSTSWDATLHVRDRESGTYIKVKLPAKPFALSLTKERAVVAMAERKIHVYDLVTLQRMVEQHGVRAFDATRDPIEPSFTEVQPWQTRESSLKFMTRDVACMPDGTGFAASSIEGRVGVEWFDEQANKQTYAFKCHREKTTVTNGESGDATPMDIIYPVNAIAFHPTHGTFATGGGDGVVALWDAKTKRRIRQYPKLPASVAALDFSPNGKFLAIAISPGFEDGKEEQEPDPALIKIYVRELADNEAKGKAAK